MFEKYDAYKDSGVDWIGSIPTHWNVLKLGSIFAQRNEKVSDQDYPALSVTKNGIVPQLDNAAKTKDGDNRKLVLKGDFVINSRSDRKGSSGLSSLDGSVSLINIVLKPRKIEPKFSHHLMKCNAFIEEYYRVGRGIVADLWTTRFEEMKTMNLALPNIKEQRKITEFLDQKTSEIDQAIAIKEQQIALLNERKQIVILKAVTQGLDSNVPMKDSGVEWIGQIPEHWEILKFKRACQFIYDGTHGSYPRVEQGYRLLSVRNIIDNEFVFREDDSCVSHKHFKEISSKFLIRNDDIQLAIVGGTLGKAAIVKNLEENIVTQRSLATLRTQPKVLNPNFLLSFIRSPKYQNFLWANAGFSAQPGVYLNTIQNSYLCMPCLKEQTLITEYIETETTKFSYLIGNIKEQIEKLKEYKTTLINDAVTGKIKVV